VEILAGVSSDETLIVSSDKPLSDGLRVREAPAP
jgi:hypothetical protein